jgi:hypothetical protein
MVALRVHFSMSLGKERLGKRINQLHRCGARLQLAAQLEKEQQETRRGGGQEEVRKGEEEQADAGRMKVEKDKTLFGLILPSSLYFLLPFLVSFSPGLLSNSSENRF